MELFYAFIKNNRIQQICVFAEQNEELANKITEEQGFDNAIWAGETSPIMYSYWDGTNFIPPTPEWLFENGLIAELPEPEDDTSIINSI